MGTFVFVSSLLMSANFSRLEGWQAGGLAGGQAACQLPQLRSPRVPFFALCIPRRSDCLSTRGDWSLHVESDDLIALTGAGGGWACGCT